jgi:hypothetical protein
MCKACRLKGHAEYRAKNPDRIKEIRANSDAKKIGQKSKPGELLQTLLGEGK